MRKNSSDIKNIQHPTTHMDQNNKKICREFPYFMSSFCHLWSGGEQSKQPLYKSLGYFDDDHLFLNLSSGDS